MFGTRIIGLVALFASCLTVVSTTGTAHAWFERTLRFHPMSPSGTGCIFMASGMSHGDAVTPFTVFRQATFRGLTGTSAACNTDMPTGVFTIIEARFDSALVKLIQDGPTQDNYSICTTFSSPVLWGETMIESNQTFPNAPCGAGWYALVTCLAGASTVQIPPWTQGNFTASSLSECAVTPFWHPFGVGDGHSPGTAVNL